VTDASAAARVVAAAGAALLAWSFGGWLSLAATLLSGCLTLACMPLFHRYAMARPNARSSHSTPVPQGGGAAIVAATLAMAVYGLGEFGFGGGPRLAWVAAGAMLLAVVGAVDDIRGLPVLPRLGLQFVAVAMVVVSALSMGRALTPLPWSLEAVALIVGGVWFVNLTNFMDGIDGITLAGFMPLATAASVMAWGKLFTPDSAVLAVAFLGALAGFVWFNLPRARLFMGDVGSLPLGLLGGALLLDMAQHGAIAAAVILPLYHAVDATTTLFGRIIRRERVWEAHRQHAYQRAVDGGWSHARVSGLVLVLNIGLALLALLTLRLGALGQFACVALALLAVASLITIFRLKSPR
jgi:UDP-N-acetylmuramyl pentapeptide phosphotransferase/UDP-N-acetylglucosamine-1-phosphate transferase